MSDISNAAHTIREYIVENFLYSADADELTLDLHLFDNGIIDSTGVLELSEFLESTFELTVEDTDMVPENFESITALVNYVKGKRGS